MRQALRFAGDLRSCVRREIVFCDGYLHLFFLCRLLSKSDHTDFGMRKDHGRIVLRVWEPDLPVQQMLREGLRLRCSPMGKHRLANHVPQRIDIRVVCAQLPVYMNSVSIPDDPGILQSKAIHVRSSPDYRQYDACISRPRLPFRTVRYAKTIRCSVDSLNGNASCDRYPASRQRFGEPDRQRFVDRRKNRGHRFENRDFRAQHVENLSHLDADWPTADDYHRTGNVAIPMRLSDESTPGRSDPSTDSRFDTEPVATAALSKLTSETPSGPSIRTTRGPVKRARPKTTFNEGICRTVESAPAAREFSMAWRLV